VVVHLHMIYSAPHADREQLGLPRHLAPSCGCAPWPGQPPHVARRLVSSPTRARSSTSCAAPERAVGDRTGELPGSEKTKGKCAEYGANFNEPRRARAVLSRPNTKSRPNRRTVPSQILSSARSRFPTSRS
jgi:hypothetical protein